MTNARARERKQVLDTALEIAIRLSVVGLLAVWCLQILRPFLLPVIWGIIIAVALGPMFDRMTVMFGGRRGLSATVFTLAALFLVIFPTFRIADSVVHASMDLAAEMEAETLNVPPPSESISEIPLVGDRLYGAWDLASTNLDAAVERFTPQIRAAGAWLLGKVGGLAGAIAQTIISLIIAGFVLTYAAPGRKASETVFSRVAGEKGNEIVQLTTDTISSVFKGVLGVALVQAGLAGIGLFLADVPAWGVWTVMVLILAVIQLPPILVLGPVAFWVFGNADSNLVGIVFLVYTLVVSVSDTFLKPMFLGRGLSIPMPVILLGAIGGMIAHGIIGLFVGAVVLAIGYSLAMAWIEDQAEAGQADATVASAGG